MQYQEVLPALDELLVELDEIVLRLNEEGAALFKAGEYDQARALLSKVESVTGFRGKVICLKDEWKALQVPATKKHPSTSDQEKRALRASTPLKKGLRTGSKDFRFPILAALTHLGGSGRVREVLSMVEEIMSDQLNHYDYQPLPSDPNSVRWKNTAQWERHNMVQDGLLAPDSPRGTWEITTFGVEALEKIKNEPDLQRKLFLGK